MNSECMHSTSRTAFYSIDDIEKIVSLRCKNCNKLLTCSMCRFGQFKGLQLRYYCIKKEELKDGVDTCLEFVYHKEQR